ISSPRMTGRARPIGAACLLAAWLSACGGGQEAGASWRSGHPDPSGITFDESAPGLCALTPQYPDQAPAAIDYLGDRYVQESRTARSTPAGKRLATSGDWTLSLSDGTLYL